MSVQYRKSKWIEQKRKKERERNRTHGQGLLGVGVEDGEERHIGMVRHSGSSLHTIQCRDDVL